MITFDPNAKKDTERYPHPCIYESVTEQSTDPTSGKLIIPEDFDSLPKCAYPELHQRAFEDALLEAMTRAIE